MFARVREAQAPFFQLGKMLGSRISAVLLFTLACFHQCTIRAEEQPYSFELSGACSGNSEIDDTYAPVNTTIDGRWYYHGQANGLYIYFDPDCDGLDGSISAQNAWLIDDDEPSTNAVSDLDGDAGCLSGGDGFKARINDDGTEPPTGTQTWRMWCGSDEGGVVNLALTVVLVGVPTLSPTATHQPTFSVQPTLASTSCYDLDDGMTDIAGNSCEDYGVDLCEDAYYYDTYIFTSSSMCCVCGGGTRTHSPTLGPTASAAPSVTPVPTRAQLYVVFTYIPLAAKTTIDGAVIDVQQSITVASMIVVSGVSVRIFSSTGAALDGGGSSAIFDVDTRITHFGRWVR